MFDLGRPAMPIDTHIHRLARRLDLVPTDANTVETERWFDRNLARGWATRYEFHVNAISHDRETCRSQRPRCRHCPLLKLCPSGVPWEPD